MEQLAKAGRIPKKESRAYERSKQLADSMLQQDWGQKTIWVTDTKCQMASQSSPSTLYTVDLLYGTCECSAAAQKGNGCAIVKIH